MEEALKEFVEEINQSKNEWDMEIDKDGSDYRKGYFEGRYMGMLEVDDLLMHIGYMINWNENLQKYQLFKRVD